MQFFRWYIDSVVLGVLLCVSILGRSLDFRIEFLVLFLFQPHTIRTDKSTLNMSVISLPPAVNLHYYEAKKRYPRLETVLRS